MCSLSYELSAALGASDSNERGSLGIWLTEAAALVSVRGGWAYLSLNVFNFS